MVYSLLLDPDFDSEKELELMSELCGIIHVEIDSVGVGGTPVLLGEKFQVWLS